MTGQYSGSHYQLVYEIIDSLPSLDEENDASRSLQFRDHILQRLCTNHFRAFGFILQEVTHLGHRPVVSTHLNEEKEVSFNTWVRLWEVDMMLRKGSKPCCNHLQRSHDRSCSGSDSVPSRPNQWEQYPLCAIRKCTKLRNKKWKKKPIASEQQWYKATNDATGDL